MLLYVNIFQVYIYIHTKKTQHIPLAPRAVKLNFKRTKASALTEAFVLEKKERENI